jgi:hypothetical protein
LSEPASTAEDQAGAAALWAALAPALAARGRLRISRDGGRSYPARGERPVTDRLPNQPAAVLLYDNAGCAPVVVFDLDASRGGIDAIARDLRLLTAALRRAGARSWFTDHSPSGGRHLYLPLAEAAPVGEVAQLMRGMRRVLATLDQVPMVNPAAGCIRPPGARHRSGGHQVLDGTLEAATAALSAPNSPESWSALLAEAATYLPVDVDQPRRPGDVDEHQDAAELRLEPLRGFTGPSADYERIARTGVYDTERYASPSEARQAVLWAAVAAGWSLRDVVSRLEDGTWRGLASMYARYAPGHRRPTLAREWHKGHAFEKQRREAAGNSSVRVCTTSSPKTHRGAPEGSTVQQQVRTWLNAIDLLSQTTDDLSHRAVLYALAEAAILSGSVVLEFGNRSLAIATGLDQSTVGRILRDLVDAPSDRALIDLIRTATGTRANTYTLIVPPLLRAAAEAKPWRRGRVHAIRPAFRELGLTAAFVYAALEQVNGPLPGRDIAREARIGVTATYEALATLSAWGLAERTSAGWTVGPASPVRVAEHVDAVQAMREQIARYRAERLEWWRYLGIIDSKAPLRTLPAPPAPPPLPPDLADSETSLQLVERILGATVIEEHSVAG